MVSCNTGSRLFLVRQPGLPRPSPPGAKRPGPGLPSPTSGLRGHTAPLRRSAAEMISLRLAVPALLVAAGCFTYFVAPPPQEVEAEQPLPSTRPNTTGPHAGTPTNIDRRPSAEERFQQAAEAILKEAPEAQASAAYEPSITGHIPLPKRRPVPRP
jgi:hypothetical protein